MKMETPNTLKLDGLTIKFCGKNDDPPTPEAHCLPLMIHSCPDDFSTLDYFDVSLICFQAHNLTNIFADVENGTCRSLVDLLKSSRQFECNRQQGQILPRICCYSKRIDCSIWSRKQSGEISNLIENKSVNDDEIFFCSG